MTLLEALRDKRLILHETEALVCAESTSQALEIIKRYTANYEIGHAPNGRNAYLIYFPSSYENEL